MLVEKAQLTSGSTCHAAGLVTQFNPSPTMMRFRRYSVELYRELGVFDELGSLRIASSRESLVELERGASRARGIGLDVNVLSPDEALELMPAASPDRCTARSGWPRTGASIPTAPRTRWPTRPARWASRAHLHPRNRHRARRRPGGAAV